jgi:hypothetical protein
MEVYQAENEETLEFLQKNSFNIYTTLWMKLLKIFTKEISLSVLPYYSDRTFRIK